ncbi:hypothetical protein L227DRAFT_613017 [Lentinus tigrinus ALCF2SS1-6]|uniref:Uncharacterized protein n=1 Tax=Lentinus tigrinus ALCF2SS1-6 TaxID=1328759 RepID=A0A5C2S433_9APHY|nr:hypothetical protein L227DRAFT_613017 [Lentinus tigrinus ALCF2SS1-6]
MSALFPPSRRQELHQATSSVQTGQVTKVYETEPYDYPTHLQESITELGTTIGHGIANFAAANLKGTNLPTPAPAPAPVEAATPQHKTLPPRYRARRDERRLRRTLDRCRQRGQARQGPHILGRRLRTRVSSRTLL